jgi:rhodanese-related sulfurtransferase
MSDIRITIAFVACILVAGCAPSGQDTSGKIQHLDARQFHEQLSATDNAVILDVRTEEEVAQGSIPGAVSIDFKRDDFEQNIARLDKEKTYFVYCASGVRSSKAADRMVELGFTKLYVLEEGIKAWKQEGFETK